MLLVSVIVKAQQNTVDLNNFSRAEVSNGLNVNFIEAEQNKAVITGTNRDKVKLEVDDGILKVNMSIIHILSKDNTLVDIYYKELDGVEAKQGSKVVLKSIISRPFISFRAQEGAEILADVEVEDITASAVTGGQLKISGVAEKQGIEVSSSGQFNGENLLGKDVDVNIKGGGTANVYSNEKVSARVRAGGKVYIFGSPVKVDQKTSFGGTIKMIN